MSLQPINIESSSIKVMKDLLTNSSIEVNYKGHRILRGPNGSVKIDLLIKRLEFFSKTPQVESLSENELNDGLECVHKIRLFYKNSDKLIFGRIWNIFDIIIGICTSPYRLITSRFCYTPRQNIEEDDYDGQHGISFGPHNIKYEFKWRLKFINKKEKVIRNVIYVPSRYPGSYCKKEESSPEPITFINEPRNSGNCVEKELGPEPIPVNPAPNPVKPKEIYNGNIGRCPKTITFKTPLQILKVNKQFDEVEQKRDDQGDNLLEDWEIELERLKKRAKANRGEGMEWPKPVESSVKAPI